MDARSFKPGFRFSALDAIVLLVGLYVSADTAAVMPWFGIAIGFVVAHFFLFCNVVRMARPLELAWAVLFVVLGASTILTGLPGWPMTLVIALAGSVLLVVLEMRKPSYHGMLWQRINPDLPEWWAANGGAVA